MLIFEQIVSTKTFSNRSQLNAIEVTKKKALECVTFFIEISTTSFSCSTRNQENLSQIS